MQALRKACSYAIVTAVSTSMMSSGAMAACTGLQGAWHVFLMQSETPNIQIQSYTVGRPNNTSSVTLRAFPSAGTPFKNSTALAIKCRLQLSGTGAFSSATCKSYGVVFGDGGDINISGHFILTNCQITGGNITLPFDPTISIRGGYVNPAQKNGAGIAQGRQRVFLFNMVKE